MFYGKIIKNDIQEFFQQMDQIILQIQFRRKKEHPKDYYLKWIDDIINHEDLNHCIILINDYFYSIFEGYDKKLFDEFEREISCLGIKYGYKNGDFYEIVQ